MLVLHLNIYTYTCSCQNTQSLNIYIVGPQLINRFSSRRIFISSFVYKLGQTCVVTIEWYIYNLLYFQKYICINNSVWLNVLEQWWASKLSLGTNFKLEDNLCELLLCLRTALFICIKFIIWTFASRGLNVYCDTSPIVGVMFQRPLR